MTNIAFGILQNMAKAKEEEKKKSTQSPTLYKKYHYHHETSQLIPISGSIHVKRNICRAKGTLSFCLNLFKGKGTFRSVVFFSPPIAH